MMKKFLLFILISTITFLFWLWNTESGLKASLQILQSYQPGVLHCHTLTGTWREGFTVYELRVNHPLATLQAQKITLKFQWFLSKTTLNQLRYAIEQLTIQHHTSQKKLHISKASGLVNLRLPATVQMFEIHQCQGNYQNLCLAMDGFFYKSPKTTKTQIQLTLGKHKIQLFSNPKDPNNIDWVLSIFKNNRCNLLKGKFYYIPRPTILFNTDNIQLFKDLLPAFPDLRGHITITAEQQGTLRHPMIAINSTLEKGTCTVPTLGLRVQNISMRISGNLFKTLSFSGTGSIDQSLFSFQGTTKLFDTLHIESQLSGHHLKLYHSENSQIFGSPKLSLQYQDTVLNIQGNIFISKGSILLPKESALFISNDVVLVQGKSNHATFTLIPNIVITIAENLKFKGYGLEGYIHGTLKLHQRKDGLYAGIGKLTIRDGKYRLQGVTRYIHSGHLAFSEHTLLNNPLLDIRISQTRFTTSHSADLGIHIQGNLQKPVYSLYSNSALSQSEILSQLGLGNFGDFQNTQNTLLSQTTFLLSGNTHTFLDSLQDRLGIEEMTLQSKQVNTLKNSYAHETTLVLGKALSQQLYLRYLHNLLEPFTKIQVQYYFSPKWSASIETSSTGLGGDIIFMMERE